MESAGSTKSATQLARQLANLKIVSRLLAHELHAQSSSKSITLSKDEVVEVQTCIDLFIEEMTRTKGGAGSAVPAETTLVGSRN